MIINSNNNNKIFILFSNKIHIKNTLIIQNLNKRYDNITTAHKLAHDL